MGGTEVEGERDATVPHAQNGPPRHGEPAHADMASARATSTWRAADWCAVRRSDARDTHPRAHCVHMPTAHCIIRGGFTLVEVMLVVTIIGLLALIGIRSVQHDLDRIATRGAVRAAGDVVARARDEAVALHTTVSVRIDTANASLELLAHGAAFGRAALGHLHGVTLSTTRDSIAFDVRGLGYGPANLSLVARRGSAADTLVVSRLGRVRF